MADKAEKGKNRKKKQRGSGGAQQAKAGDGGANAVTVPADSGFSSDVTNSNAAAAAGASADGAPAAAAAGGGGAAALPHLDDFQLAKIKKAMDMLQLKQQQQSVLAAAAAAANEAGAGAAAKTADDAAKKSFEFWSTQPVPRLDEEVTTNEAISPDIPLDKLRREPYSLPAGFKWDTLNIDDPLVLKELYVLLNENYVEDDDNMFRFDYSPAFLHWALQPPGSIREWHCGVRSDTKKSNKLVGFISAVPAHVKVYDAHKRMVEINFLCVHKKLRSKRLAPVLIREMTRRVNCTGIFQAVYTAGVVLPKPVATCRYWHRSLNPKKLIEVKFSHLSRNMTMQRHLKLYRLPEETKTGGLRKMKASDVPEACKLMNEYLSRYDLAPIFNEEDFTHWFLPRDDIIQSYVVEGEKGKLTDMVSFYSLPSTVMSHPTHRTLRAAYSFYNVSNTVAWVDLVGDALVLAKRAGFDVFNALDLMENTEFLEKLKFGIGDGNLQYYLYNWRCPQMAPNKIGLVLQ